jgi:peptidyl-prolyl cis-trans isomerase D
MNIKNFVTKVIVIILACLLVFMGIGNFLSDDNQKEELARVGKEVITLDEYEPLYKNYIKQIPASNMNEAEIKKLKYDLLNALIEQKLLLNLVSELGLAVGEESIKDYIKNTKYFQNDKGEFDKDKFYETLNSLNITEKEYVSKLEKMLPVVMFMTALFKENYPITFGKEIDEKIYKNRYQTRVVDVVKITSDSVTNIPEPDNPSLIDLYEKNKSNFSYPEYRTAQYISLGPKYFEDQIAVSDKEINDVIEKQELKDQRDIFNLILPTKEEAEAARKAFEEGKVDFKQMVEEFGKAKFENIKINNITKDFLPESMRGKVFALKVGEISEALESSFGWHLIKIENIHQISDADLVDLKKDIKSVLINQKSFEKVNDFINQVNYKIYNGATIEGISNQYSLPIQNIGPVDESRKDQNGNSLENSSDLISLIFSQQKDQKNYFKSTGDAIVSVQIIDIIPSKSQSFEEARSSVVELWRNKFIKEKMFKIGQKVVTQLKEKTNLEEIQNVELLKMQQIGRGKSNYPFAFIEEIFNMKTIASVTNPIEHNDEVIIGVLREIYSSDGKLNTFDTGKHVMISLKEQLISYLESKYKIEVNHAALDSM